MEQLKDKKQIKMKQTVEINLSLYASNKYTK